MNTPLAERMRPHNLDEVVGQKHLIEGLNRIKNSIWLKKFDKKFKE